MSGLLKSKKSTTQTSKVTLPGWVQGPLSDALERASELSEREFTPYQGQRIAGITDDELAAMDMVRDAVGIAPEGASDAIDITREVARRGLAGFTTRDLQPYMNPYLDNVLEATKRSKFEDFDREMSEYRQRASQARAFGGSRFGLGEAAMKRDFRQDLTDYENRARAAAFESALNQAQQGTTRAGQAAQQLGGLSQLAQQSRFADATALSRVGQNLRANEQADLDVAYQDWLQEQEYPFKQVQFLQNMALPTANLMAGSENTTTTRNKMSPLQAIAGVGTMAAGAMTGNPMLMSAGASSLSGAGGGPTPTIGSQGNPGMRNSWGGTYITDPAPSYYGPPAPTQGQANLAYIYGGYKDGGVVTPSRKPEISDKRRKGVNQRQLEAFWEWVEDKHGLPRNHMRTMRQIESAGGKLLDAKHSSATGPYQILDAFYEDYFVPRPKEGEKDPRYDEFVSGEGVAKRHRLNAKSFKKDFRRDPTGAELYLMHQQGLGGGKKLLKNEDKLAKDVLGRRRLELNLPSNLADRVDDMTAKEFIDLYRGKYDRLGKVGERESMRVAKYQQGGAVSALGQDYADLTGMYLGPLQEMFETGRENLSMVPMRTAEGLGSLVDYVTLPRGRTSETTELLKALREDAELGIAGNRLARGLKPLAQRNLEGSVARLADDPDVLEAYLDPRTGGYSTVSVPQKEEITTKRPSADSLEEIVASNLAKVEQKTGAAPKRRRSEGQQQQQQQQHQESSTKKEKGMNLPLIAFGAALLSADPSKPPISAFGEAAQAAINTHLGLKNQEIENRESARKQALEERRADLYERQILAQEKRTDNPYTMLKQQLELQKMSEQLSGEEDLQRRIASMFSDYTEQGYPPEVASKLVQQRLTEENRLLGTKGGNQGGFRLLGIERP